MPRCQRKGTMKMKSVINFYDGHHEKFVIWKESQYIMKPVATGDTYGLQLRDGWVTIEELEFILETAKAKIRILESTKGFTGFDF